MKKPLILLAACLCAGLAAHAQVAPVPAGATMSNPPTAPINGTVTPTTRPMNPASRTTSPLNQATLDQRPLNQTNVANPAVNTTTTPTVTGERQLQEPALSPTTTVSPRTGARRPRTTMPTTTPPR